MIFKGIYNAIAHARNRIAPTHKHRWRMHEEFTAPVGEPPGHTKFYLRVCDTCRTVTAFPMANWDLINQNWKDEVMKQWALNNIRFVREDK